MSHDYTSHRIVCLQPSATVILSAVGQFDRVVACTKYCADVVPEAGNGTRIIVADSWTATADPILAARPDLVIAAVPYQERALGEILKAGVRFLGLAPKALADIYGDIATIAAVVGAAAEGQRVIDEMRTEIERVRSATAALLKPTVYCEEWGKPLIHSQRWVAELIEAAGGVFVGCPGARAMPEAILAQAPEVIVAAWCGAGDRVPLEKIIRDRAWHDTPAAKAGRIFCIRDEFLNTPAPTLVQGLRSLAAALHPENFPHTDGLRCISGLR